MCVCVCLRARLCVKHICTEQIACIEDAESKGIKIYEILEEVSETACAHPPPSPTAVRARTCVFRLAHSYNATAVCAGDGLHGSRVCSRRGRNSDRVLRGE